MNKPSQSIAVAQIRARPQRVTEGVKGAHWWREDLDAVAAILADRKRRQVNLAMYEKLGGETT